MTSEDRHAIALGYLVSQIATLRRMSEVQILGELIRYLDRVEREVTKGGY
jgi:hypothetical protein